MMIIHLTVRAATVLTLLSLLAALPACGSSQESAIEDSIDCTREGTAIFQSITDEASAKAAAPKLEAWAKKMDSMKGPLESMQDLPADQQETLMKKYGEEMQKAMAELSQAMMKVMMDPKLQPYLEEAQRKVQEALGK